jgi:hypothetical protein
MAPIDQAYTKMLNDIVLLIVGGIGGIVGKRAVNSMRIYTEDGSMGQAGRVTDPIPEIIKDLNIAVVYSCA